MAPAFAQAPDPRDDFATAADFSRRFFDAGNYTAALTWLQKADSVFRDQPAVLYDTALVFVKLQRYDEAQRVLDRYIALFPQGQELQSIKTLQRDLQFGVEVRGRERHDNDYRTLFSRAKALYAKNLRGEALDAFRQAEQIHADDPPLYYDEAVLYEEDGSLEAALRAYDRYLQTAPANAPELQARMIDLEREIGDMRTKLMCPYCGAKLPAGARWCHHCWHGPYDVTSAAWNARACEANDVVTVTIIDAAGKTRIAQPAECLFAGRSLHDLLQYRPPIQSAIRNGRVAEGWVLGPDSRLQSFHGAGGTDISLEGSDHVLRVENVASGEAFPYKAHATADGIWLLDGQYYSTGDQLFLVNRSFDVDGRLLREDVRYDTTACRHAVTYAAAYTYEGENVVAAQITGGYAGSRVEGYPQVQWSVAMSRAFDQSARLSHEELSVTSLQKTYNGKPQGRVSDEVRRVYTTLKTRRPIDVRPTGDICGAAANGLLVEPIDLRPLFVISPALAVRFAPGDVKVNVDYAYNDKNSGH
jgi:tetratricopeptide (TPR) repeat protein